MQVTAVSQGHEQERLLTSAFLLVLAGTFAYFVSVGMLIPAVPLFVEGPLAGDGFAVGIAVGAFSFSALLLRPLAGRWADRYGSRRLIASGAVVAAVSTLTYGLAGSLPVLVALRLVTGAGEALFFVGALSAVGALAPAARRGEAMSFFTLAPYAGVAVGPLVSETALGAVGFSGIWVMAAASAAIAAAGGRALGAAPASPPSGSGRLLHPAAVVPGLVLLTSWWSFTCFIAFTPLYALDVGLSGSRLVFLVFSAIMLGIRSLGAKIPDRLGAPRSARLALLFVTVGMAVAGGWRTPAGLLLGAAVFAVGNALAFPALMSLALQNAPASERGAVVGTFTAFLDLAFGLGALSLGFVASQVGYGGSFLGASLVALIGLTIVSRARTLASPVRT